MVFNRRKRVSYLQNPYMGFQFPGVSKRGKKWGEKILEFFVEFRFFNKFKIARALVVGLLSPLLHL